MYSTVSKAAEPRQSHTRRNTSARVNGNAERPTKPLNRDSRKAVAALAQGQDGNAERPTRPLEAAWA